MVRVTHLPTFASIIVWTIVMAVIILLRPLLTLEMHYKVPDDVANLFKLIHNLVICRLGQIGTSPRMYTNVLKYNVEE